MKWRPPKGAALAEVLLALAAFAWLMAQEGLRALWFVGAGAILGGARSMVELAAIDPATLRPGIEVMAKSALLLAPVIRMLALSPRHRLAWIPFGLVIWPAILGNAVPGVTGWLMWLLFGVAAGVAWVAVKRPALRAAALLPSVIALEPLLGHSPLSDIAWSPERLASKCATNDGTRPVDFRPDIATTRYFSVTPVSPELMLLTGERRSFWVRRADDGVAHLGPALRLTGNFWQGCVKAGKVWLTSRARVCEATPPAGPDAPGEHACYDVPGSAEVGVELDYVDVLCAEQRDSVYVGQLMRGGLIEFDPLTRSSTWHPVLPGLNLQFVARKDGRFVGITTTRLLVFDPGTERVLEEQAAGIVAMGIDICASDDAVAVADFTGRLRLFERSEDGGAYRLRAGAHVPAPRRVAFSPSCEHLVVTSGDDRHAFLLRRRDLQVIRTWNLGPGLRDVVFLDEHRVAAADGCTVNFLDATP